MLWAGWEPVAAPAPRWQTGPPALLPRGLRLCCPRGGFGRGWVRRLRAGVCTHPEPRTDPASAWVTATQGHRCPQHMALAVPLVMPRLQGERGRSPRSGTACRRRKRKEERHEGPVREAGGWEPRAGGFAGMLPAQRFHGWELQKAFMAKGGEAP